MLKATEKNHSTLCRLSVRGAKDEKKNGNRKQKVHIYYEPFGFIPVDVLLKAEQA